METFTYDELRLIRDTLNEFIAADEDQPIIDSAIDKLDRMIQSKQEAQSA